MFFIVVVVHSFKRYLLEYLSFWIYSHSIPFAAWVLCILFVQFVKNADVVLSSVLLCMHRPLNNITTLTAWKNLHPVVCVCRHYNGYIHRPHDNIITVAMCKTLQTMVHT
jgi:hypothetical protein